MEILALVKRVPATDCKIKIRPDGRGIDPTGVEWVMNPYDEYAVEEALATKEARGGTVTVLSIGPADTEKVLRNALAMGADKAVHLKHEGEGLDGHVTAHALTEKIRELGAEIVYCGKQAVDGDGMQVGPRVATQLGWSCVTDASTLELGEGSWEATRDIEGGRERVTGSLPAVITCNKGLNEPRYPNIKGIMMAKKKPLDSTDAQVGDPAVELVSVAPPPARPEPAILGEGPEAVASLIQKLRDEAKVL